MLNEPRWFLRGHVMYQRVGRQHHLTIRLRERRVMFGFVTS